MLSSSNSFAVNLPKKKQSERPAKEGLGMRAPGLGRSRV